MPKEPKKRRFHICLCPSFYFSLVRNLVPYVYYLLQIESELETNIVRMCRIPQNAKNNTLTKSDRSKMYNEATEMEINPMLLSSFG